MAASVYILHSESLAGYYIGMTSLEPDDRLIQHNTKQVSGSFTTKGIPWTIFVTLECDNMEHARLVERHIKRMKSQIYIQNLKQYAEMRSRLLARYRAQSR